MLDTPWRATIIWSYMQLSQTCLVSGLSISSKFLVSCLFRPWQQQTIRNLLSANLHKCSVPTAVLLVLSLHVVQGLKLIHGNQICPFLNWQPRKCNVHGNSGKIEQVWWRKCQHEVNKVYGKDKGKVVSNLERKKKTREKAKKSHVFHMMQRYI